VGALEGIDGLEGLDGQAAKALKQLTSSAASRERRREWNKVLARKTRVKKKAELDTLRSQVKQPHVQAAFAASIRSFSHVAWLCPPTSWGHDGWVQVAMLQSENDRLKDAMRSTAPRALSSKVPCFPHHANLYLAPYLVLSLVLSLAPYPRPFLQGTATPNKSPRLLRPLHSRGMDAYPRPPVVPLSVLIRS